MKLARKVMLYFEIGTLVLVGLYAWFDLQDDLAAIRREAVTELAGIARGAGNDVSAADIRVLDNDEIDVRWVPADAAPLTPVETGDRLSVYRRIPGHSEVLEVSKDTGDIDRFRREAIVRSVIVMTSIIVLGTLYSSSLGAVIVGRPLRRLVAHFRRVGRGDLSPIVVAPRHDEVGELEVELSAMIGQLSEARVRADRDHAARLAVVAQLEHADRLATVGRLASGLAHELGTPLNVISGYAKLIAAGEETGQSAATCGRIIGEQVDRTARIVRQLLDFARRGEPRLVVGDVRGCVERALTVAAIAAKNSSVRVDHPVPDQPLLAEIDDGRLHQVVVNLVNNAIQASTAGQRVEVRVARQDHEIRLDVVDHGHGIPPADLAHVFDPFFTTKPVGAGTGLGLSVSHGIVQDHRGRIEVASEVDKGTTFSVFLPQASA